MVITGDSKSHDFSSILNTPTFFMRNSISFIYKGKLYNPKNPEKKLKQLGITWNDVDIVSEEVKESVEEELDNIKLYYFLDPVTNYSITSINSETPQGYIPITLEELKQIWNVY